MAFMICICWRARSPETERMRMRAFRAEADSVAYWSGCEVVVVFVEGAERERESLFV